MTAQRELVFDGPGVTEQDTKRLSAQHDRVLRIMRDGQWRTLAELSNATKRFTLSADPEASVSARLRDFRKPRFGAYTVERRRRQGHVGLWEYRMVFP